MPIRLIVTFTALPGKGAEMAAAFTPVAKEVQKEKGCEQYEMFVGAQSPEAVVLLERWTTATDLDVHAQAMRARGPSPTTPFRAEVPPTVERFEVSPLSACKPSRPQASIASPQGRRSITELPLPGPPILKLCGTKG